jgi:hypothetical protein
MINPIKTSVKANRKVNQKMSKSRFLLSHSRPHLSTFLTVANIQTKFGDNENVRQTLVFQTP